MNEYAVTNILDLKDAIGEDELKNILSQFSCPLNLEVEHFVRENALEFAKRKLSITYLVLDEEGRVAAIFALAHKALQVTGKNLSSSTRKKLLRYAQIDEETGELTVSAFLIGQFGKNYQYEDAPRLEGKRLMTAVFEVLIHVQHEIGGGVVYLECEDKPQLLGFYQNEENRFKLFGKRSSKEEGVQYLQLLRLF